ncbi:MAG: hypothetical protein ACP5QT_09190 [Brevinematia bacterium]
MKNKALFILILFLFSCRGIHLNIQQPLTFKEGKIKSAVIKDERLELKVKTTSGYANIFIQPWKKIEGISFSLNGMVLKSSPIVSPAGLSRILSFYKNDRLVFSIGNRVKENSILPGGFKIKRGDLIGEETTGPIWTGIRLEREGESFNLLPGQILELKAEERGFYFLFLGASLPDSKQERSDIVVEKAPFSADYIIFLPSSSE